jgi:hypothetical protein
MMVALRILVACGLMAAGIFGVRAETSPYAGVENRGLKTLSEQQIEDFRGGRGMGMALAAELNSYPGPAHVRVCPWLAGLFIMRNIAGPPVLRKRQTRSPARTTKARFSQLV